MKKIVLTVLGLIGICSVASAQNEGFGWGIKGGMNIAGISNRAHGVSKVSVALGVFADYRFSQKFALSADLLYSRQGGSTKGINFKERLNYLSVPILANYYVWDNVSVKAGIQPGFLLGAKTVAKNDGTTTKTDIGSAYKGMDFSIPVGVGYDLPLGFSLEARYNIGVINISNINGISHRNSVFQVLVGYRF